jgi:urease accessory protein
LPTSARTATFTRASPASPTTTTITRTVTEAARAAELVVERVGGRLAVTALRRGSRVAPRVLATGASVVRAAFVPFQAGPLGGDRDVVRMRVGAGAALVIEPIAATLALPGRIELVLDVEVGEGGRLVLDEPPLIVAAGADVVRAVRLRLAAGAVVAVRDTVVLGRSGETPGRLAATLRATLDGVPLLHDTLLVEPATWTADAHVALAPGHRAIGTVSLLGARADDDAFALHGPGALRRASGAGAAEAEAALAETWGEWVSVAAPGTTRTASKGGP